jgi:hypothetical protein
MSKTALTKWQMLAEQASVEMDSEKLSQIVEQLCLELDLVIKPKNQQSDQLSMTHSLSG